MRFKLDEVVIASTNNNKIKEMQDILKNISIKAEGIQDDFDVEETGTTFYENAYIKAFEAAKMLNKPALADDSGLVVDALNGAPGVYSARYAENDQKRIERVIQELKNYKPFEKTARFVCSMVLVNPDGEVLHACEGKCEGFIVNKPKGEHGFGYDPVFYLPELGLTMAELSMEEKNKVSHRSKALKCMIEWLKSSDN